MSPKLNTEHNELATSSSLELGVRPVFPVESLSEGEAGLAVSSMAGAAVTPDWADNRRVNRDLGALPKRKAVCDDLEGRREGRKKGKNERCFVALICWNSRSSCEVGLNKAIGGFENWWEALLTIF